MKRWNFTARNRRRIFAKAQSTVDFCSLALKNKVSRVALVAAGKDEILKSIAIFRIIMPSQVLRCAAGRKSLGENGKAAFESGANALISCDFLTTAGTANNEDVRMLQAMGFELA